MKLTYLIIAALASTLGASGQATAVTQNRIDRQTAVNNCQAALPSFTGFRLRPLGITNEGATSAFLSCSFSTDSSGSLGNSEVDVFFTNIGTTNVDVSCTLISGLGSAFGSTTLFFPKTFRLGAGANIKLWTAAGDSGGVLFQQPSISCAIPPNVEVNSTTIIYKTDVGQ